ncbi:rod shape-determining protein [Geobacter sp. DSM 9736]|uniref:rod shape-determining protein n=1 Tax=Geobacter sp. DSM 9736 TaxID=1277350 RepID=UPI000B4FEBC1|nr:rod shape-determining protein [Geobacter sp. DSM 9736]SNB46287.1 rod shape-determining protein MreB [Geobacter sp. DSM 9736]
MPRFDLHWRQHVALDVGTATTRIATGTKSFLVKPSVAEGKPALANGVVVDPEGVLQLLKPLLDRAKLFGMLKPCVLACAPSDARPEERALLRHSIMKAGAASVSMIPEPLAAAIGSGLDVTSPYAQMVIDIGEGVTDCAVIVSGKILATCAVRKGCSHMRSAIIQTARENGWTISDENYAELLMRTRGIKREPAERGSTLAAVGLQSVVENIAMTAQCFFKDLPDSLGCDIIDSGICLTGGGSLIPGVREYIERHLGISIKPAGNPLTSVAEGARAILPVIFSPNNRLSSPLGGNYH